MPNKFTFMVEAKSTQMGTSNLNSSYKKNRDGFIAISRITVNDDRLRMVSSRKFNKCMKFHFQQGFCTL